MDRGQNNNSTSGNADDVSYQDRGSDNLADLTRSDENAMDRVAEAGVSGAFGAKDADGLREQMQQDAASAFGGEEQGSGQGASGGSGSGS